MRVLERILALRTWFGGRTGLAVLLGRVPEYDATVCDWCGEQLGPDGCDRCAELDAKTIAFFND